MSTDKAGDCIHEHLAKWRKTAREYLFAPLESLGAGSGPGDVAYFPDDKRFRPDTTGTVVQSKVATEEILFHPVSQIRSSRSGYCPEHTGRCCTCCGEPHNTRKTR